MLPSNIPRKLLSPETTGKCSGSPTVVVSIKLKFNIAILYPVFIGQHNIPICYSLTHTMSQAYVEVHCTLKEEGISEHVLPRY